MSEYWSSTASGLADIGGIGSTYFGTGAGFIGILRTEPMDDDATTSERVLWPIVLELMLKI